jgi:hypothetical protein
VDASGPSSEGQHLLERSSTNPPPESRPPAMQEVPRLKCSSLSVQDFRMYWPKGVPVVVTGVDTQIPGSYGPEYFIAEYGRKRITLHDCESERTKSATVADFFSTFGTSACREKIWKLKVHFSLRALAHLLMLWHCRTGLPSRISRATLRNFTRPF